MEEFWIEHQFKMTRATPLGALALAPLAVCCCCIALLVGSKFPRCHSSSCESRKATPAARRRTRCSLLLLLAAAWLARPCAALRMEVHAPGAVVADGARVEIKIGLSGEAHETATLSSSQTLFCYLCLPTLRVTRCRPISWGVGHGFLLRSLPPGRHELEAWLEHARARGAGEPGGELLLPGGRLLGPLHRRVSGAAARRSFTVVANSAPRGAAVADFPDTSMRVKRVLPGLLLQYSSVDQMVGASLDQLGEWEGEALELLSELLRPGDVALDLGAYVGSFGLAFADLVHPSGHVHVFEPQRVLSDMIHASVALNKQLWERVTVHRVAVGAAARTLRIPKIDYTTPGTWVDLAFSVEPESGIATSRNQSFAGLEEERYYGVRQLALDELDLPCPALVKIDVELMELDVLRGAAGLFARCGASPAQAAAQQHRVRPALYMENNHIRSAQSQALMEHVTGRLGYLCFYHVFPYRRGAGRNFFGAAPPPALFRFMISYNVLCVDERFGAGAAGGGGKEGAGRFARLPFDAAAHGMPPYRDVWTDKICPELCESSQAAGGQQQGAAEKQCEPQPQLELMHSMGICKAPTRRPDEAKAS